MAIMKYLGEFFYGVSAVCVLFAAVTAGLIVFFLPFAVGIYLGDVLDYNNFIAFSSIITIYSIYYIIARHFNIIDFKEI